MSISEKIKATNNKIEQSKAQCSLEKQTAAISDLSAGNVTKYKFLTCKDDLPWKKLLEKAAALKRFEYLILDSELKKQTSVAEIQYQRLYKLFNPDGKEESVK